MDWSGTVKPRLNSPRKRHLYQPVLFARWQVNRVLQRWRRLCDGQFIQCESWRLHHGCSRWQSKARKRKRGVNPISMPRVTAFIIISTMVNSSFGSYKTDGSDDRTIFKSTYGTFLVSPNGKWVAFIDLYKVYVGAFPQTGKPD